MLLFAATGLLAQQEPPKVEPQPNTVYVSADGKFEAPPDTALVQFNISAQEDTAEVAYDRARKAAEQVRQIMRSNGIDPKQAQIGFFSVQPVEDWRDPKHKIMSYQVSSSVSLKLADFSKIAPIVEQLAQIDVTGNESLNYTLENMDAAKQKAVADAYGHARESAETVAQAGGRVLGTLLYASVDTFEQVRPVQMAPMARMPGMAAAPQPAPTSEFTPQTVSVTAHVNALFGLQQLR
jgi:uncharacterized protein YggE